MKISYARDMRAGMLAGVNKIADAIRVTLGPAGRNVALYQKKNVRDAEYSDAAESGAHVLITNDGATIAQSIVLPDPVENMGAMLLKEASNTVNGSAGDGTTTTAVLTQQILSEVFRCEAAGAAPVLLCSGMKKAGEAALQALREGAVKISTQEELSQAAAVSCGDLELGAMIGEAFYKVGLDGVVKVEESRRRKTTLELREGIVLERGYTADFMAVDNDRTSVELDEPYILLCDTKFTDPQDILPFLILCAEDGRDALVISEGVEGQALGLIAQNQKEGDMKVVCINAPLYGEGRRWRMEDLAVQTGGFFITKELKMDIRAVTREMVGSAGHVTVTKNRTVITEPHGDPAIVTAKISEIRHLIEGCDYDFNRERYQERLAAYVSGIAVIAVGADTEPELWEKKMKVEDAVNAARAAWEEGIAPGGGVALMNLVPTAEAVAASLSGDERTGAEAVARALAAPIAQIAWNAGIDGGLIMARLSQAAPGTGYDAETGLYVDMLAAGIVDPVKVTRLALECALSISEQILMTEAGVSGMRSDGNA